MRGSTVSVCSRPSTVKVTDRSKEALQTGRKRCLPGGARDLPHPAAGGEGAQPVGLGDTRDDDLGDPLLELDPCGCMMSGDIAEHQSLADRRTGTGIAVAERVRSIVPGRIELVYDAAVLVEHPTHPVCG